MGGQLVPLPLLLSRMRGRNAQDGRHKGARQHRHNYGAEEDSSTYKHGEGGVGEVDRLSEAANVRPSPHRIYSLKGDRG